MTSEMPHIVAVERIPTDGYKFSITATDEQREAIAQRFDIPGVNILSGNGRLQRDAGCYVMKADITADLERICVITLESISETVTDTFEIIFLNEAPDGEDNEGDGLPDYELVENGEIDIGEILIQQVSLVMQPYPRCDDAEPDTAGMADPGDSPFSALEKLQKT